MFVVANNFCLAQNLEKSEASSKGHREREEVYIVQLTEFRMKKASDAKISASDIIKALDEMKDNGEIEIVETIRLSAFPGLKSMVQIGRIATVTTGVISAPGRVQHRQSQRQDIGTLVELTADPSNGKVLLNLAFEASRFDDEGTETTPPDTTTFAINTTLLLTPGKTTFVGGTSADGSSFLAVSVK